MEAGSLLAARQVESFVRYRAKRVVREVVLEDADMARVARLSLLLGPLSRRMEHFVEERK
jgi:hypothetical protein